MKDPLEEVQVAETPRSGTAFLVLMILGLVLLGAVVPGSRTPLIIVAGIVVMVMLHELGHFVMARRSGMKATEFYLGFGRPKLFSFRKGETEFGVKPIVLGGYVRIVGMTNLEEVDPADESRTFRQGSYRNRLEVILAGVTMNFLLAFVLFFVVIAGQGQVSEGPSTTIRTVVADSAARAAGLQVGDRLVSVAGARIRDWDQLVSIIQDHPGTTLRLVVDRHGRRVELTATPREENGVGFLGVSPRTTYRSVGFFEAIPESFNTMGKVLTGTGQAFEHVPDVFTGLDKVGTPAPTSGPGAQRSLERPRSIVGIVDVGSQIAGNVWGMLALLGIVSFSLGLINLLPVLPFDGGHAAVVLFEWIASKVRRRRIRVDYQKLLPVTYAFMVLFLAFAVSTILLDVRDAIGGS
ncbi:MAG TPA: M50 family metallopeptidase [Acidimicrobiia bacterium]|nr:M50 family metallopeptidase [Acidimicrobiia bacterium]